MTFFPMCCKCEGSRGNIAKLKIIACFSHNGGLNMTAFKGSINQTATSAVVKVNHTLTATSPTWMRSKGNHCREGGQLLHLGKQCLPLSTPLQQARACVHTITCARAL